MGRVLVFDRLLSATERNEVLRTLVLQWSLYQEPYTSLEIDELRIASSSLSSSFITSYIESGSYPQLVGGQQVALRPRIDPEPVVSYSGTLPILSTGSNAIDRLNSTYNGTVLLSTMDNGFE